MGYSFNIAPKENLTYYLESAQNILGRLTQKAKMLVDIGSHVGILPVMAIKEAHFDFAIAVEPHFENFCRLVDNIKTNGCEGKVLPIWAAISTKNYQTGTLYNNNGGG